jgi:hypothetical protein
MPHDAAPTRGGKVKCQVVTVVTPRLRCNAYLAERSIDLVLADLPYGTTQNRWDSAIPLQPLWEAYLRVCKKTAAIVLTSSQPFTSVLVTSKREFWTLPIAGL